jgi:iron(III) transport system substrate-binding protein
LDGEENDGPVKPGHDEEGGMRYSTLAAVIVTLPLAAQAAEPKTVAEIAAYTGADRQVVLEAGAKKEGEILIYQIGTQSAPIIEAFGKKYPFLKVQPQRNDSTIQARRTIEEYSAGRYIVDAFELDRAATRTIKDAGFLQSFKSPELDIMEDRAKEPGGYWANDYESYVSLGYNTKLVSEADVPKTYEDLLNPKWTGKMAMPSTTTSVNFIGAALKERPESFLEQLGKQKFRIYEISGRAVANLVVSGEVPLSPAIYNSHMANSADQGASVAWRAIGGVYSTTGAVALASKAPHPHAAMLYLDFMLSKEGQQMMQKIGYASARRDLTNREKPERIYYLGDEPDYDKNYEKWSDLLRKYFGKAEKGPEGAK